MLADKYFPLQNYYGSCTSWENQTRLKMRMTLSSTDQQPKEAFTTRDLPALITVTYIKYHSTSLIEGISDVWCSTWQENEKVRISYPYFSLFSCFLESNRTKRVRPFYLRASLQTREHLMSRPTGPRLKGNISAESDRRKQEMHRISDTRILGGRTSSSYRVCLQT